MNSRSEMKSVALTATIVAVSMIASQVAGKATRDALFLSNFDITSLPLMLITSSLLSLLLVLGTSRAMHRLGPSVFVPAAFASSSLLLLLEWWLLWHYPRAAAVTLYIHFAVFNLILISGFWSLINELFDPRSGKKLISRIATGGTIGGVAGGIFAERMAADFSVLWMLPSIALMQLLCSLLLLRTTKRDRSRRRHVLSSETEVAYRSGLRVWASQPYLRSLTYLVVLGTISAALIDYVFKAQASASLTKAEELLRFFAVYYTGVGLLAVIIQGSLSRTALQRFGLARTVSTVPISVVLGSLGALFFPGLAGATIARAGEATLRSSLFRSAYELLYTPVPKAEKRATKSLIDVTFERLGDALGGGIVRLILFTGTLLSQSVMLVTAAVLGGFGLLVARKIHLGYVQTLERSLRDHAIELDLSEVEDKTTRITLVRSSAVRGLQSQDQPDEMPLGSRGEGRPRIFQRDLAGADPVLKAIADLRSGDQGRVVAVLSSEDEIDLRLAPFVIQLLAWDTVAPEAIKCLRRIALSITGQLTDELLNRKQDFSVRRRVPRVLGASISQRAADGLMLGLSDRRFEVRFQCGKALSQILERDSLIHISPKKVHDAVLREVAVDKRVWESHRLLDQFDDSEPAEFLVDEFLRDRVNRSLEHVFRILSLTLPKEPLKIALKGILTEDAALRGTALEYLESILPPKIRERLFPFLEYDGSKEGVLKKSREQILDDLMQSNRSIQISLEELRKYWKQDT